MWDSLVFFGGSVAVHLPQHYFFLTLRSLFQLKVGSTKIRTRGCWVRSANATSVLCFMAGVRTQPLKGISIQTAPAPLLGLQQVANVPGGFFSFAGHSSLLLLSSSTLLLTWLSLSFVAVFASSHFFCHCNPWKKLFYGISFFNKCIFALRPRPL